MALGDRELIDTSLSLSKYVSSSFMACIIHLNEETNHYIIGVLDSAIFPARQVENNVIKKGHIV